MTTFTWSPVPSRFGTPTNLGTAANWISINPFVSVPTTADTLDFNRLAGGTLTGTGVGLNANFNGPGAWVLNGALLTLAGNTDISGTTATAKVTAQGGAQITSLSTSLGSAAGQTGNLTVTGSSAIGPTSWTTTALTVGGAGQGTLTVSSGGIVAAGSVAVGSKGHIDLAAGGTLSASGPMTVATAGSITLEGGTLTLSNPAPSLLRVGATMSGFGTVNGSITDNGTINATGGLLTLSGPVGGSGQINIGTGATLDVKSTTAASDTISFQDSTGTLVVQQTGTVGAIISGFVAGDTIDLSSLKFAPGATATIAGGVLKVTSGAVTETLSLTGIGNGSSFSVTADSSGTGTYVGVVSVLPGGLIAGTAGNDTLTAPADGAAYTLLGRAGNDTLIGGTGNDTLNGGAGIDTMTGGAGNDTYFVDNAKDVVNEAVGGGSDTVWASVSYTLATGTTLAPGPEIEFLRANSATGVTLTGNQFSHHIFGGAGNDTLIGGTGNDALSGGAGNDILNGGAGNDTLTGGAGSDVFQFSAAGFGHDIITDFSTNPVVGVDQIDISGLGITAATFASSVKIAASGVGGVNTLITIGTGSIQLNGVAAATVGQNDFHLAL